MPEIKKVCANCGEELKESEKYCPICGAKYVAPVVKKVCASCGEELKENERYCPICGTKYDGPVGVPTVVTPPAETPKAETRAAGMATAHTAPIISGVGHSTAGGQAAKEQPAPSSNKMMIILISAAALIGVMVVVYFAVISPKLKEDKYNRAWTLIEQGQVLEGYNLLKELGDYKDSLTIVNQYGPILETIGNLTNNSGSMNSGSMNSLPGMNNSGSFGGGNSTVENSKPESSKPESSKPESSKPESSKPESSKPESSKPESSKPESSKPENSSANNSQVSTPVTYDSYGNPIMQFPPAKSNTLGLPEAKDFDWDMFDWNMNVKSGVLTISGNGAMPTYVDDMDGGWDNIPWIDYSPGITQIQVEEGITVITMMAFRFAGVEKLYLPHSLKEIDDKAFASYGALSVIYYNGTMNEWKQIRKARTWDAGNGVYDWNERPYRIVCTDGELKQETNPYCGEDARWIYDDRESTVTVYGTGSIDDYNNGDQPWGGNSIKHFVVEEGITTLTAFCTINNGSESLETIEIPSSLQKLGFLMIWSPADSFTVNYHGTMEEWEALLKKSYIDSGWGKLEFFYDYDGDPSHVKVVCTDGTMDQLSKVYS